MVIVVLNEFDQRMVTKKLYLIFYIAWLTSTLVSVSLLYSMLLPRMMKSLHLEYSVKMFLFQYPWKMSCIRWNMSASFIKVKGETLQSWHSCSSLIFYQLRPLITTKITCPTHKMIMIDNNIWVDHPRASCVSFETQL